MKQKNKIFIISGAAFVAICLALSLDFLSFLKDPLVEANQKPAYFLFTQGMSVKKAAASLRQKNLIKRPLFFDLLARFKGVERNLKAGEYLIEPGITTPTQLLAKMVKGDAVRHAFTIVEGWTFSQMIATLNNNSYIKHTIQKSNSDEIMGTIGYSGELPEGRFAPDTYLFSGEVKDTYILTNAYKLMQKRLQAAWNNRAADAPYRCPYEALIVASMIEKETAFEQEKPIIAGVILRRLAMGKLLQVDPTVIYGLGEKYSGKLSKLDLTKDTPYNTYTRKGLPPTPIALPSKASIEAALHPTSGTVLYYVAKGDGTHKFSDTLKEQSKAVKKYLPHK
ncbi:Endolytic murein transglycosylase [Gammaproteobacteria bacterium]